MKSDSVIFFRTSKIFSTIIAMSDTVYYYKIWCNTDSQYEYVWADEEPTVCPVNNAHSVNTSSISIIDEVSTNKVKILEENVPTGENFMCECHTITYGTGVGEVTTQNFSWPFPINVLELQLVSKTENEGDQVKLCIAPDTTIGIITVDAATGATGTNVSSTVIENIMVGYHTCLTNGVDAFDCGRVLNVDSGTSKISWENPLTFPFSAASPTYVKMTVYVVNNYTIGPAQLYLVGEGKIGASHVPTGTIVRALITNVSGSDTPKTLSTQFEYLY